MHHAVECYSSVVLAEAGQPGVHLTSYCINLPVALPLQYMANTLNVLKL